MRGFVRALALAIVFLSAHVRGEIRLFDEHTIDPVVSIGDKEYRLESDVILGDGGVGVVYPAVDIGTGKKVALKILRLKRIHLSGDSNGVHSAVRALQANQRRQVLRDKEGWLNPVLSAGVFRSKETGTGRSHTFMGVVSARLSSPPLSRLREHFVISGDEPDRELRLQRCERLARQLMAAVATLGDASLVHSDLKPSNIFFTSDTDGFDPRAFDRGESHVLLNDFDTLGRQGKLETRRSQGFYPPEAAGPKPLGTSLRDVYGIGVALRRTMGDTVTPEWIEHQRTRLSSAARLSASFVANFVQAATKDDPLERARAIEALFPREYHFGIVTGRLRSSARPGPFLSSCLLAWKNVTGR